MFAERAAGRSLVLAETNMSCQWPGRQLARDGSKSSLLSELVFAIGVVFRLLCRIGGI